MERDRERERETGRELQTVCYKAILSFCLSFSRLIIGEREREREKQKQQEKEK